jgi:metal-sulfur cluster biosynthetic enzyme
MSRSAEIAGVADRDTLVEDALGQVFDPCSMAVNNPLSIVDMGLVRQWHLDERGRISVTMCVTGPGCMMFPKFVDAARAELMKLSFVREVDIAVDVSVLWTEDLMTERGRRLQHERHRHSHTIRPVRPQQWRESARPD